MKKCDEDPKSKHFHPVINEFQDLLETNTRLYLLVTEMFDEVPKKDPYNKGPSGKRIVRGYKHMLQVMNHLLTVPPSWSDQPNKIGLIAKPIYALFDWPMGTSSGFSFFLDPHINAMLKKVLTVWGEFLQSEDSASCLDEVKTGWFGATAFKELTETGNLYGKTDFKFHELYQCPDSSAKRHGFTSWDHFFTREFQWEKRPVAEPNDQNIIANCCESQPYRLAHNVAYRDKFWTKGMPYSVADILQHDESTDQFVGGTIYQAFLSALSYHRWHTPVDGVIKKIVYVPGTYYSEPLFEDFSGNQNSNGEGGPALAGISYAQAYITAVATRVNIYIEADNPAIGLCCVVQVGMSEVSSCEVTVKEGEKVKKGQEIGMFHFGGSTFCLLFRKGVEVKGLPDPERENWDRNVPVRSKLGEVVSGG